MDANAARIDEMAASTEPRLCAPGDERDRVIDTIARLLTSGQPLTEILQHMKRTADGNDTIHGNGAAEPNGQPNEVPDELRDTRPKSETIQSLEPVDAMLAHEEVSDLPGAFDPNASIVGALDPGTSLGQQSLHPAPVCRTWRIRLSGLLEAVLFWLIPAVSLAVVSVAGKSVVNSNAVENVAQAAAIGVTEIVRPGKNKPVFFGAGADNTEADKRTASGLFVEPAFAEPKPVQSDHAEPQTAPLDNAEPKVTEPDHLESQTAESDRTQPQTAQLDRASQLTPEQIRALLDRGDALVGKADIEAARVSYEQAVATGNPEAALRLGATYDPGFLTQAGLRNAGGDALVAQYWYGRARDLEQNQSQFPPQATRVMRATDAVSTLKRAESTTGGGQVIIQTTDATPASIQPMPPVSSSQIRSRRRVPERHTRNH